MDASLRHGLLSILLLHVFLSEVLIAAETPLVQESILPPTEAIAQEAEVKEQALSPPAAEQEVAQEVEQEVDVVHDAGEDVAQQATEEVAVEIAGAAPEATAEAQEPAPQEAEAGEEVSQEAAAEVAGEAAAGAGEEPAPEEEVTAEAAAEVGEPAVEAPADTDGGEQAVAEPAPAETAPEPEGQGETAMAEDVEEVVEELKQEAAVEEGVDVGTETAEENTEEAVVDSNETGASQGSETEEPDVTPGPADTYMPAQSQGPASPASPEETNDVGGEIIQESDGFNQIITSEDELLNLAPAEPAATPINTAEGEEEAEAEAELVEEVGEVEEEVVPATPSMPLLEEQMGEDGESVEAAADEAAGLGLEAWKIGAISAAVFLFLETIVIIVYFLKCRRKTASGAVPVQACEDCEAAETTAEEEAAESSPAAEDQTLQNNISESLDASQFQQEETMADIPLDPPVESSPEEPADDVRTSAL